MPILDARNRSSRMRPRRRKRLNRMRNVLSPRPQRSRMAAGTGLRRGGLGSDRMRRDRMMRDRMRNEAMGGGRRVRPVRPGGNRQGRLRSRAGQGLRRRGY